MATIKLKKGFSLNMAGPLASGDVEKLPQPNVCAITPDDFTGIIPRLEVREGDPVKAGQVIFHHKDCEELKVVSPVSGTVKAVVRGERRKIMRIEIACDGNSDSVKIDLNQDAKSVLLQSGLWAMLRQRPYDVVPSPAVEPRDIFVTCFDSAPLAPSLIDVMGDKAKYLEQGVKALKQLTRGNVYLGFAPGQEMAVAGAETNVFQGPHPAGNAGVQIANVKPVNKGEVVWTLDVVTLARIGELFATGTVSFDTVVALVGQEVEKPVMLRTVMGAPIEGITASRFKADGLPKRIISGNVLSGVRVEPDGYLRAPYRQVSVIPEVAHPDEFMGWASLSPSKFSVYRNFLSGLFKTGRQVKLDARINGGERAIVMSGEYDAMLPMDILAEFLVKAIIAFDIEKMEALGIYEVAPEDFALAEFACTSKLELQRIVREGLDRMRKEME